MPNPQNPFAGLQTVPASTDPFAGLHTVADNGGAAHDGSAAAGGAWTPAPLAQTATTEDVLRSYAPGFVAAHPHIAGALAGVGDFLQGGGRELIGQGIRLAGAVSPKTGAALKRVAGDYATTIPGADESLGKGAALIGEFLAPAGAEEMLAGKIGGALSSAPSIVRGAAQLLPSAATGAGITALQGGNPYVGAAANVGGALAGAGLKRLAGGLAESAAGVLPKMRKFGRAYGRMILDETEGFRPTTVANSAQDAIDRIDAERTAMAQTAGRPVVVSRPVTPQLALPPGPPERIPVPLHDATAVVERPSALQPAAENRFGAPVVLRQPEIEVTVERDPATGRMVRRERVAPGTNPPTLPAYATSPASSLIPPDASWRNPAEQRAAEFLDRLDAEGGNGVTYPGGHMNEGAVAHPLKEPLRTTRTSETAQGVWLRTPEPAPSVAPATRPEAVGLHLARPNTISRAPAENAAADYANTLENRFHEEPGGARAVHAQVQRFNPDMSPSEAVDLSRAMARHVDFGRMPGIGHPDTAAAALAARHANELQLEGLLGSHFGELGNHESALIALKNAMLRRSLAPGVAQRVVERGAARTGALASALLGAEAAGPAGAVAAPILQELSTMPSIRMAAARFADRPAAGFVRAAIPTVASALTRKDAR